MKLFPYGLAEHVTDKTINEPSISNSNFSHPTAEGVGKTKAYPLI